MNILQIINKIYEIGFSIISKENFTKINTKFDIYKNIMIINSLSHQHLTKKKILCKFLLSSYIEII